VRSTIAFLQLTTSRRNVRQLAPAVALLILIWQSPPSLAEQASRQESNGLGAIEGQVVDAEGAPVQGVTVTARNYLPGTYALPLAKTDAEGHFTLESVWSGWVHVATSKQEDGYPDTSWGELVDCGPETRLMVPVVHGETTRGVILQLGPRRGILTGSVADAATGKPLVLAELKLFRDDMPESWLTRGPEKDGEFLFALPELDYTLQVSANGYEPWRSDEDGRQIPTQHIRIPNGEVLRLEIRLEPVKRKAH
jgi:hypothetical protein